MATIAPGGAPSMQIVVGVVINSRYEIVREIGRGGMGIVYLARDRMMEKDVALKVIPQELCLDPRAVADLKRETSIAIELTHQNIVRLYNLDTWQGQAFVVMEYVNGGTLAHLMANGTISLDQALPYLQQIGAALDYSHSSSPAVIHRDLKPLNILLTEDGSAKVADFGLARVMRDSATRVSGHDSAGTLAYMAPEQIRGKGVGKGTDTYAFSAITYEFLSGNPPFYTSELRCQILHEEVEPIENQPAHVNEALMCGLARDREDRPSTASELMALLTGEKRIVAQKKKKRSKKQQSGQRKKQAGAGAGIGKILAAVALLLGLAGGGFAGWKFFKPEMEQLLRGAPILTVASEPPGAMVYVDEGRVEPTPTAVSRLTDGTHLVRLEKEKYLPYSEKIFI
ncbi:MAG: protein kinase, partial [Gammaproteobacteria bacterium]|nr:protein kinase [Gammaproteobacteria bacterium]